MNSLKIIKPGLMTTLQDLGRFGFRSAGISPTGVMDSHSAKIANWLVGNEDHFALLEITVIGPEIEFTGDQIISICGADLMPQLNGKAISNWQAISVAEGDVLSFAGLTAGARAYLAVAGGLQVPEVLGSRSTHLKAGFGGFEGRALKSGDCIPVEILAADRYLKAGNTCPKAYVKSTDDGAYQRLAAMGAPSETQLRILFGPQDQRFTEAGKQTLIHSPYSVTGLCDRMGFRLQGACIEHVSGADLLSDANAVGTLQVTGEGQPILLMQDAGTTGGYTKIATVIGVDLHKIGQLKSGDVIRFHSVSREAARALAVREAETMAALKNQLMSYERSPDRWFKVRVNGIDYEVSVALVEDK